VYYKTINLFIQMIW